MNFFKVVGQLGHQGAGKFQDIIFYIEASNIVDACSQVQRMPGVKKHKDVMNARTISLEEYLEGRKVSAYSPFSK